MNPQYLNLSRSQLSVAWQRSRFNHYSDKRKQMFHDSLGELYDKLMAIDFEDPALNNVELNFFKNVLEFSKSSLSLLDNNTISSVPHEFIECLNAAAKEWIPNFEQYIIVMHDGPYAIMPQVDNVKIFYVLLKARLGVTFNHILLSVSMPRQLSRDYLTNVCLFHELGHFVDTKYKIAETTSLELRDKWIGGQKKEVEQWFLNNEPFVNDTVKGTPVVITLPPTISYIKEYFSDLFAAQYVDEKYLYYLDYLSDSPKTDDFTHPSYFKRHLMYEDYCKGPGSNIVLDTLFEKTLNLTKHGITRRFVDLDPSDMFGLLPTILNNEQEMLSIFNMGWEVYKSGSAPFEKANGLSAPLPPDRLYEAVNNLIEKSINNYLIVRDWNNAIKNP